MSEHQETAAADESDASAEAGSNAMGDDTNGDTSKPLEYSSLQPYQGGTAYDSDADPEHPFDDYHDQEEEEDLEAIADDYDGFLEAPPQDDEEDEGEEKEDDDSDDALDNASGDD